MEGIDSTLIMLVTSLIVPFVGAFMAATPYLMRRGEVFAVTVPTSAQGDPFVKALKRRYAAIVGGATAVLTAVGLGCAMAGAAGGVMGTLVVGSLALTAGGYGLMLAFRAKMVAYKRERGWEADAQEAVAVVGEQPVPHAISVSGTCCTCPSWRSRWRWGRSDTLRCPIKFPCTWTSTEL